MPEIRESAWELGIGIYYIPVMPKAQSEKLNYPFQKNIRSYPFFIFLKKNYLTILVHIGRYISVRFKAGWNYYNLLLRVMCYC